MHHPQPILARLESKVNYQQIPFVEEIQTFECDCEGQEFEIQQHGITVNIDRGTVAEGETVQFEYGITLFGSFIFTDNKRPISPILWLCSNETTTFKKPITVTLPHCLVGLTEEEISHFEVSFAKANHNRCEISCDGQQVFIFNPSPSPQSFDGSSGVLNTYHCCFLCIVAKNTHEIALRAGYCLSCIDYSPSPTQHEIYVCATFLLQSCLEV